MSKLSYAQSECLRLMKASQGKMELYEGASKGDSRFGSGQCFLTYSAGINYPHMALVEAQNLARQGLIKEKWPGSGCACWTIVQ